VGFREHLMIGGDVTRAIGGAGSWLEAAYVFVNALGGERDNTSNDYLRLSLGCDYSFPGNIYAYIEYHYNQAGTADPDGYNDILGTPAYQDGAVFLLGRHYLAPGASFQITPLMTLLGQVLLNITDPSALLVAVLDYNISEDIYLEFGTYLGVGENPERVIDNNRKTPPLSFNSEFGSYTDMLYTSFRIYF
jgi:hypothetical protein